MRNRSLFLILLMLTSSMHSVIFSWPFAKEVPKTLAEKMREAVVSAVSEDKQRLLVACVGAVPMYFLGKKLYHQMPKLYKKVKTAYESSPRLFHGMGSLGLLSGAGLLVHNYGIDTFLADLSKKYPFTSGLIAGSTATSCALFAFLKNILKQNVKLIRGLDKSRVMHNKLLAVIKILTNDVNNIKNATQCDLIERYLSEAQNYHLIDEFNQLREKAPGKWAAAGEEQSIGERIFWDAYNEFEVSLFNHLCESAGLGGTV